MNIHIVFTGGTIGSSLRPDGTLAPSFDEIKNLTKGGGFTYSSPFSMLSENMSPQRWNKLIMHIRKLNREDMDALFITHGTDTLSYTSNLLALLCYGMKIPVFLIASNLPFHMEGSNGPANLKAAIAMTGKGIRPGVYVPWKDPALIEPINLRRSMWDPDADMRDVTLFDGGKLLQAADYSATFNGIADTKTNDLQKLAAHARDELRKVGGVKTQFPEDDNNDMPLIDFVPSLIANILTIRPYPGIRYDAYDLSGVSAVLHGTYHSFTVSDTEEKDMSIDAFAIEAREMNIPLYLAPLASCDVPEYASTKRVLNPGNVIPLYDVSFEMAFALLNVLFSKFELNLQ